jgi:type III pantothenate kinase
MLISPVLLVDIGNTHTHLYAGKKVIHLVHNIAIKKYADKPLHYISVNQSMEEKIARETSWKNVSSLLVLEGAYDTMGVDRRALCMSHSDGLFVDAGSAITVDVMRAGVYQGGFILPGLAASLRAYSEISPVLDRELNRKVSLESLPLTTKDGISYGIIAPIKAVIEKHQKGKTLYFSGGDGAFLSTLFEGSVFDETLVFQGMRRALKKMQV